MDARRRQPARRENPACRGQHRQPGTPAHLLGYAGAEVEVVENGRLAVERAEAGGFDLVLMDMNMPEMDGYEATQDAPRPRIPTSDPGA